MPPTVAEPSPPGAVWIDARLIVHESPIEGHGLFASEPIPSGAVVLRLGGRLVSSTTLDALIAAARADPAAPHVDTITVGDGVHLVLPPGTDAHFCNHSCDPTLWHVGPYEIAARRDLQRGDEATVDYATHSGAAGFVMPCHCRSRACRGRVTSDDWRLPELQRRYRGHWVPALDQRIAARHRCR